MLEWEPRQSMIDIDRDIAFQQRMLEVLDARTKASIHNIANQNVAGFKRYVVRFEDLLKQAEQDGQPTEGVEPHTERDPSGPPGQNNVVLMEELATLGKTQLLHDVVSRRVGGYFSTLNKAVFGR